MRLCVVLAAVALFGALAGTAAAGDCGYNRGVVVQTQVVTPVVAQVVVPQVVSQVAVVPVVQHVQAVQVVKQQKVVVQNQGFYGSGGFQRAQFVGGGGFGRQRFAGGGGGQGPVAGIINAIGNVANSPAGLVALGGILGR